MAKVGRFVTDPEACAYCQVVLDSGEKLVVNHDKGGFKGGLKRALAELTRAAKEGSVEAAPLGAFVNYVKDRGWNSESC